ncbi:hypothetical protein ACFP1Z_10600 [Streptomyces gamaensis]|uniref:DUF1449 family protein n=1 Tax=Streptomyces gamaensis TaxID=1763542 RepID=A0ABW0YVS2_9ACTN
MDDFLRAALAFPAVLFSFALVVVAAYWLLVLLGGADVDALDGGDGVDAGATGMPVTVAVSLAIVIAWFVSLAGTALTEHPWLRASALPVALAAGWLTVGLLRRLGRRLLPPERPASRGDFVGRTCVVRTGRVGGDFGQAEVRADDGSTAIVQVRAGEADRAGLTTGSTALIYDYDADGEYFRIAPYSSELDPYRPAH